MKLSTAASAGVLALACWTFPALAQAPSQAAPPATAPHSGEFPGTLDPATKIFTPLGPGPKTPQAPVQGTIDFKLVFDLDPDFSDLDTIFCNLTLDFGDLGPPPNFTFLPDYHAFASFDFFAGLPPPSVKVPYDDTPISETGIVTIKLACEGRGDSGEQHSFDETLDIVGLNSVPSEFRAIVRF